MSGEVIYMKTDFATKKLDSLFIFGNAFIIEKDSLSDNGYNQIVGTELYGDFLDGALNELDVIKNTQVLYYLYSDTGELVGIDKTICSALNITFKENEIEDISFYVDPKRCVSRQRTRSQPEKAGRLFMAGRRTPQNIGRPV